MRKQGLIQHLESRINAPPALIVTTQSITSSVVREGVTKRPRTYV